MPRDFGKPLNLKLETAVRAVAIERGAMHYRVRKEAPNAIPAGARIPYDLRLRLRGVITKDAVGSEYDAPPIDTILHPAVLARLAVGLGVKPERLAEELVRAALAFVVNDTFVAEEAMDPKDPHVLALDLAAKRVIPGLRPNTATRNASVRAIDTQVTYYRGSTVDGKPHSQE